ncbi:MAG: T9SS type A sorting domain-containing protein, partial [Bacteroidia bacterium]
YCSNQPIVTLAGSPSGGSFTVNGNVATTFAPATALASNSIVYTAIGCSTTATFTVAQGTTVQLSQNGGITSGSGITTITQACVGTPITLTATTAGASVTNYQWQRNGADIAGQVGSSLTLSSGWGVYRVRISNVNACITNADTFAISFRNLPNAQAGTDRTTCVGTTANLGNVNNANYTYSWYPTMGLSSATVSNPTIITPSGTNTYTVYVSQAIANAGGLVCQKSDAVVVTGIAAPSVPTLSTSTATEVCQGNTITLVPNVTGAAYLNWYRDGALWATTTSMGSRNITAPSNATINYTIKAKSAAGCLSPNSNGVNAWVKNAPQPTVLYNGTASPQTINLCASQGTTALLTANITPSIDVATYSWKKGSSFIVNQNNSSYLATATNVLTAYYVKIDYANGCVRTSSGRGLRLSTTCRTNEVGEEILEEVENEMIVKVYPNPASQEVTIVANDLAGEMAVVNLYNVLGEKVLTQNLPILGGAFSNTMNIGKLASGIYTLVVSSGEISHTQKVIKE